LIAQTYFMPFIKSKAHAYNDYRFINIYEKVPEK